MTDDDDDDDDVGYQDNFIYSLFFQKENYLSIVKIKWKQEKEVNEIV